MKTTKILSILSTILMVVVYNHALGKKGGAESTSEIETPSLKSNWFYHGPRELKLIALTYDDGPNRRFTPRLLELLKRENVPATFFWLGQQIKYYPQEAKQLYELGFEIGNHSFYHKSLTKLSREEIYEEISSTQEIIKKTTGITPTLLRPPYGSVNQNVVEVAEELGLQIIMWSLDTDDWRQDCTKEKIVDKVLKNIRGGDIILMHDRNSRTIEATAELIPALRARGFRFVKVSQLLLSQKMLTDYKTLNQKKLYTSLLNFITPLIFP